MFLFMLFRGEEGARRKAEKVARKMLMMSMRVLKSGAVINNVILQLFICQKVSRRGRGRSRNWISRARVDDVNSRFTPSLQ